MITIGKTKSVCPECMKVVPAIKGIGEDGIYLVKECNAHGKFQTLIWEGNEMCIRDRCKQRIEFFIKKNFFPG